MPTRLCLEPRCPNPATARGRCDEHRKLLERERSRRRRAATAGVYKRKRWEIVRRFVLNRDPICKVCDKRLSTEVDHIVPLAEGGNPYDPAGLQGICSPCHRAKTRAENARRPLPRSGDLPRAAGELQVAGPVQAELCSRLVQGDPHTVHPLLHRVADEADLDPVEARLERNGPAERIGQRGEQLAVPRVVGLEQVQDDQGGHRRIVWEAS